MVPASSALRNTAFSMVLADTQRTRKGVSPEEFPTSPAPPTGALAAGAAGADPPPIFPLPPAGTCWFPAGAADPLGSALEYFLSAFHVTSTCTILAQGESSMIRLT